MPEKYILKRFNKTVKNFSQILEMRISFISSYRPMSYKHYLRQKLPMVEIKLNQILNRDPSVINPLNRELPYPLINHYDFILFIL